MLAHDEFLRSARRPARILVAEDDPEMRSVLTDALSRDGYEVEGVANGGRLLVHLVQSDRFRRNVFDLVVSDVRMPICSGLDILETMRRAGWRMPFVLMTAFPELAMHSSAARLGARLLEKPFSLADFSGTVADVLARSAADRRRRDVT